MPQWHTKHYHCFVPEHNCFGWRPVSVFIKKYNISVQNSFILPILKNNVIPCKSLWAADFSCLFQCDGWTCSSVTQFIKFQYYSWTGKLCNLFCYRLLLKFRVFWDVARCSQVDVERRFRGAYCLHHQGNHHSSPWWWRQYAPLKYRSTSTWPHGATSQKTLNFMLSAVRTWNLTFIKCFRYNPSLKDQRALFFIAL
jgi:hypothetical protein